MPTFTAEGLIKYETEMGLEALRASVMNKWGSLHGWELRDTPDGWQWSGPAGYDSDEIRREAMETFDKSIASYLNTHCGGIELYTG